MSSNSDRQQILQKLFPDEDMSTGSLVNLVSGHFNRFDQPYFGFEYGHGPFLAFCLGCGKSLMKKPSEGETEKEVSERWFEAGPAPGTHGWHCPRCRKGWASLTSPEWEFADKAIEIKNKLFDFYIWKAYKPDPSRAWQVLN